MPVSYADLSVAERQQMEYILSQPVTVTKITFGPGGHELYPFESPLVHLGPRIWEAITSTGSLIASARFFIPSLSKIVMFSSLTLNAALAYAVFDTHNDLCEEKIKSKKLEKKNANLLKQLENLGGTKNRQLSEGVVTTETLIHETEVFKKYLRVYKKSHPEASAAYTGVKDLLRQLRIKADGEARTRIEKEMAQARPVEEPALADHNSEAPEFLLFTSPTRKTRKSGSSMREFPCSPLRID
ncbi:MAG: hypothetical protein ACOYK9_01220 [Chlamydiia bacterium]